MIEKMKSEPIGIRDIEACRMIGVSRAKFWQLHSSGRLPRPRHLGRCVRWDAEELRAWFKAGCPERERWEVMKSGV